MAALPALAQNHLKIKDVFDRYGKQEGAVLVQLSTDILSQGSRMTLYKSLVINNNDRKAAEIIEAVKADTNGKPIMTEVKKDGKIDSGTYYLGTNKATKESEFILYKRNSNKITLVYIKGKFPSGELDKELKKLKDLFIYVNNKRIKLQ